MTQKKEWKNITYTWSKVAQHYNMDLETLHENLKQIRPQLDACVGRSNYRILNIKQLQIIKKHMEGE